MFFSVQKNLLIVVVLLSTLNLCFGWEIKKLFFYYALFTKGMHLYLSIYIFTKSSFMGLYCFHIILLLLFVWFDSLRPINILSVIKGLVFLGRTSTKLGLMFLLKDTTQWRWWGLNPRPLGLESSTLPLSHCTTSDCCIFIDLLFDLEVVQPRKGSHVMVHIKLKGMKSKMIFKQILQFYTHTPHS